MIFVDCEAVAVAWINSRTATLVGPGRPLPKGAYLKELDGPPPTPYVYVSNPVPGGHAFGEEQPDHVAPLSLQVYGPTKQSAADGAVALANELQALSGVPARVVLARGETVDVLVVDDVSGPAWAPIAPGAEVSRYVITADWYLSLVPS